MQKQRLCGMHAINNLLQEPKVVFLPNDQRLIIPTTLPCDDDPLTKTNQINIAERCRIHQLREEATQSVSGTEINKCDMKTGDFNIEVLQSVLESELDYNTDTTYSMTKEMMDKVKLRDFLESHSNTPNLKGFILNYRNGYHWTTVIKNSGPPCNYLLIDSIRLLQSIYEQKNYACFENLDTLVDFLVTQNTTTVIAVFNGPNERIHAVEEILKLDKITARRIVRWTQEGDAKDLYKHERELLASIDTLDKTETKRQQSRRGGLTPPEQELLTHLGIDPVQSPLRPLLSEFFMQLPKCQTDTSIFVQQQCEVPYRVLWQQMFLRRKAVEPVKPTIDMFTIAFLEKYLKEADRAIAFANAERLFRTGSLDTVTDPTTGTATDPTTDTATDPTTDLELEALVDLFTF